MGVKRKEKNKENEKACILGKQEPLLVFSEKEAQEYDLYCGLHVNASHSQYGSEGYSPDIRVIL